MRGYHRDVVEFLKGHGAHDVDLTHRGQAHPRVKFWFRGKQFNIPISGSPSDVNATSQTVRDLKKMLGEPDVPQPRSPRTLANMTAELAASTPSVSLPIQATETAATPPPPIQEPMNLRGSLAMYRNGNRLQIRFAFPPKVAEALGTEKGVNVKMTGPNVWQLSNGVKGPKVFKESEQRFVLYGGQNPALTVGFTGPIGSSPTEYSIDGSVVTARLRTEDIAPITRRLPSDTARRDHLEERRVVAAAPQPQARVAVDQPVQRAPEPVIQPVQRAPEPVIQPVQRPTEGVPRDLNTQILAVLRAINIVETSTAYRLVKLETGWAFRAPTIRLGDKE